MPRWKSSTNLLGVKKDGEVFDPNWLDNPYADMPPTVPWLENRPLRVEEVDIWEVIAERSGLCGVYAAWCPYAELYIVLENWSIVAEFSGIGANGRLEQYLISNQIPYPYQP
jgi:hypothetical protein